MKIRSGLVLLTVVFTAHAAELKPETVKAWQEYVHAATARMQERLNPDGHFLKIDENRDWGQRVRSGEILVLPDGAKSIKKVPSGLIHDWVGAVFVPHATLSDVLSVVRDYDRYKQIYRPSVIDSRARERREHEDRFSMVLLNKSLFLKGALDSDYQSSYIRVSDRRWYSVTETTRIQEIDDYGEPAQHALSEGEGSGLIWRLFSITRFDERDDGVYIELEAIALSRDIPISLRWIVEPIVRRVSIASMTTSLRQTEGAVRSGTALADAKTPVERYPTVTSDVLPSPRNSSAVHSLR
ncbi:MAG: hypothetical protein JOY54_20765 [Acidobacteriaceae bacterium]|nr:hypothetical protein [Acidobacteriaceae bacterium]